MTIMRGRDIDGDLSLSADVVIIGTGAGGAVVAAEAAAAGRSVICLEEGAYVPAAEHGQMRPSESLRALWRDGGLSFAVGLRDTPTINVTMGKGVGGSSSVTGGVCLRPPDHVLDRWARDCGLPELAPRAFEPYLEAVEKMMRVSLVPEHMRSRGTVLFGEGLEKAHGHKLAPLPRNTVDCQGAAKCNFGCPNHAKMPVDVSVLPRALEHHADIIADCLVGRIVFTGARATGVEGRLLDAHGKPRGKVVVHGKDIVLAAGAWHDPLLLRKTHVAKATKQVGRNMTLHPSFRMVARFDETVRGWEGSLQSAFSTAFMDKGLTLVSLFIPPGMVAATMPGVGPAYARRAADVEKVSVFGGLVHDEAGGTVHAVPFAREPLVTYQMAKETRRLVPDVIRTMAGIYFAAGAREVYAPILGSEPMTPDNFKKVELEKLPGRRFECTSQHPMGTCRMGVDRKVSVVDARGRPWDTEGLWVADGSIVPTSLGVNPQVTVMAMALRVAHKLLEAKV